jgi:hypothetical protein
MRVALMVLRATGITWIYAVILGCLLLVRQSWIDPRFYSGTFASRLQISAKTVWFLSPYIALTASLFALIAIPLAVWAVGSASWSSLKKYIYIFWSVLATAAVVSGNANGLILISGAGLIALWFLANLKRLNPAKVRLNHNPRVQMPLQKFGISSDFAVFAILAVITCVLSLFLFFGNGTKVYVSEIFAIYTIASVCQGFKAFAANVHGQNVSPEKIP